MTHAGWRDCGNVLRLADEGHSRLIDVEWGRTAESNFPANIKLVAYDRQGLLHDVSAVFAAESVNVVAVHSHTDDARQMAVMRLTIRVTDLGQLSRVLTKLNQLRNVVEAGREV